MKLKPLGNRIVVEPLTEEETTKLKKEGVI